jgi:hypothetical protein
MSWRRWKKLTVNITAKYFYDQVKEDTVGGAYGPRVLYHKCIDVCKKVRKVLMY